MSNKMFYTFFTIGALLLLAMLGWSLSHPSQADNTACIRAGYDGASWRMFAPEGYCFKYVPFSEALDDNENR